MLSVAELSEVKRNLLHNLVHGAAGHRLPPQVISSNSSSQNAPLTFSQERLIVRESARPAIPPLYNECVVLRMRGDLCIPVLEDSLAEIIRRHESWRTTYSLTTDEVLQRVHPASESIELPVTDLRGLSAIEQEQQIHQLIAPLVRQPFNLGDGALLRVRVVRIGDFEHRLYLVAHLSILDGLSAYRIFPFELAALYCAKIRGQHANLPPLPIQFSDYSRWQRRAGQIKELDMQLDYWRTRLRDGVPPLNWPADRNRPKQETFRGMIQPFVLGLPVTHAIKTIPRKYGVTLFVTLLSLLAALLHVYTRQDDFAIGTPSPCGRKRSELQNLLGYFLTPIAICFRIAKAMTFAELLIEAQKLTLEAISHDDFPVEVLAQKLNLRTDPSRNPLFTVAASLQPTMPRLDLNWSVTSMDVNSGGAPWDLYLAFIDREAEIMGRAQYNPDLFEARVIEDYQKIALLISSNPEIRLSQIALAFA
jgi:Condensation domain